MTVCAWERVRGGGGRGFPRPPLVRRDREKRESIMQTASTPFSHESLPSTGTVLRETEDSSATVQAWEGTRHSAPVPPNPTASCKVRARPQQAQGWVHFPVGQSPPPPPSWDNEGPALRQVLVKPEGQAGEGSSRRGQASFRLSPTLPSSQVGF